jgi:hypothetical protein
LSRELIRRIDAGAKKSKENLHLKSTDIGKEAALGREYRRQRAVASACSTQSMTVLNGVIDFASVTPPTVRAAQSLRRLTSS